jgi:hypothetical protein
MDKLLTPQQEAFLSYYTNPKSETFGNARQSALKAQYSETYADNITNSMPEWLSENIGSMKRLRKAERNLDEVQGLEVTTPEGRIIPEVLRERTKVDMFMAERIGKNIYSTKGEDGLKDLADNIKSIVVNKNYGGKE